MLKSNTTKGGEKSPLTKRQTRYGKLVRGWPWRTFADRLAKAEAVRVKLGINQTEMLERALDEFMERNG